LRLKIEREEVVQAEPGYKEGLIKRMFKRAVLKILPKGYPPVINEHLFRLYLALGQKVWQCSPEVIFEFEESKAGKGIKPLIVPLPAGLPLPVTRVFIEPSIWENNINWIEFLKKLGESPEAFAFVKTPNGREVDFKRVLDLGLQIELRMYVRDGVRMEFRIPSQTKTMVIYSGKVFRHWVEGKVRRWERFFKIDPKKTDDILVFQDVALRQAFSIFKEEDEPLSAAEAAELRRALGAPSLTRVPGDVSVPEASFCYRYDGSLPELPTEITEELLLAFESWNQ